MTTTAEPPVVIPPDLDPFLSSKKGRDILELLRAGVSVQRVTAIGQYHRSWTAGEVTWAKRRYIDNAPAPGQFVPTGFLPVPTSQPPRRVEISRRQSEIIDMLGQGYRVDHIADTLNLAANTVEGYVRDLARTFDTSSPGEAVALAMTGQVRMFIVDRRGGRPSTGQRAA